MEERFGISFSTLHLRADLRTSVAAVFRVLLCVSVPVEYTPFDRVSNGETIPRGVTLWPMIWD